MAESVNGRQTEEPEMGLKQIIKGEDPRIIAFLRRQVPLIILIIVLTLVYIGNRYDSQCDLVRIEQMKKELVDVRYQALNITSDVSAKSKPSYIESTMDSDESGLHTSSKPSYKIGNRKKR